MKIGKSEFCANSPDTLILDLENGYNAHPGVYRVPIARWSDIKLVLRQLEKPAAQAKYKNIAIDTLNGAWDLCTTFICAQNDVQKIKDIPYGQGYKDRDAEFEQVIRKIINLNYGLILTCHTKESVIGTKDDIDIKAIAPDLDKRCLPIVNGLVDIIGVITQTWNEAGESERWLLTKATPTITAGSRWPHLASKIPFGYKYLEKAIVEAIAVSEKEDGATVVDKAEVAAAEILDFNKVRAEAQELWTKLIEKDQENAKVIGKKIEMIFGRPMKLSEVQENQVDLMQLIVVEMRDMI